MNIRPLTEADIDAGLALCRIAGWNHVPEDWQTYRACGAMFVAQEAGAVFATAAAIAYDTDLAWIGVVLTHPDFRGRGAATGLMQTCVDHLRGRGVRSIKLDASDMGKPIYQRLGFVDEQPIIRYRGAAGGGGPACREIRDDHWPAIASLDSQAFGADRLLLLRRIHGQAGVVSVLVESQGRLAAYAMARPGQLASYVGPLVATDPAAAREAAGRLLHALPAGPVFWDALPRNADAAALIQSRGFGPARTLSRMYLGENTAGTCSIVYAVAGMEYG